MWPAGQAQADAGGLYGGWDLEDDDQVVVLIPMFAGNDKLAAFSSSMDTRCSQNGDGKGGDIRQCEAEPSHHGCHAILLKFLMKHSVKQLLLAKPLPSLQLVVQLLLLEHGSED